MPHVQKALAAWRDAERELERTSDPADIAQLQDRIRELQSEYQRAVDARMAEPVADAAPDAHER